MSWWSTRMAEPSSAPLLEAEGLSKQFVLKDSPLRRVRRRPPEVLRAVDDVSLTIQRGETVGLVGESGCGKSTFGRLLLHLEEPTRGRIRYDGAEVTSHDARAVQRLRRKIQIIFQDPYSSLNPRKTVRAALHEVLSVHKLCSPAERKDRIDALLERVGLSPDMANRKPHQFSGGQRQRIGIARALAVDPEFIVADEPVSALDVSIQAQVLNLMMHLQDDLKLTYLFISHNLGVVRHVSQRVAVMYLGRIVEMAPTAELFAEPLHPYTRALLRAVPSLDPDVGTQTAAVEGDLPNPINPPTGCHFHPRCPFAMEICRQEYPALRSMGLGRKVACHLYPENPVLLSK
jgi:oligopeptide transport system ATP-binding protein